MIDMDMENIFDTLTLEDDIENCINEYTDMDGNLLPSVDDITLEEALDKVFTKHPDAVRSFSVAQETVFENPSYITGYISVCWIDHCGNLNHETAQWEVI
jgi:hypothetical protein